MLRGRFFTKRFDLLKMNEAYDDAFPPELAGR
jgi:hypothetical protein